MTILALVLPGTVWMVLPRESQSQSLARLSRLRAEKTSADQELDRLSKRALNQPAEDPLSVVSRQIAERKKTIALLEREFALLSPQLGPGPQQRRITELRKEIDGRRTEVENLDRQIDNARRHAEQAKALQQKENSELARMQNQIEAREQELEKLRKQPDAAGAIKGTQVFESAKPKALQFMVFGRRVYPLNEETLEVQQRGYTQVNGRRMSAVRVGRKASAKGDALDDLASPSSEFQRALRSANTKEHRILFYVDGKSFEILRKTRQLAVARGFEVGWWPSEQDTFVIVTEEGFEGVKPPSTDAAK